jgi:O-antigen ligase
LFDHDGATDPQIDPQIDPRVDPQTDHPSRRTPITRGDRVGLATILLITLAYVLSMHSLDASRAWQEAQSAGLTELASRVEQGRASRQIGMLALGAWGLAHVMMPAIGRRFRFNTAVLVPLAVLIFWSFGSIAWSVDPALTLRRLIVFSCVLLAVAGFVKHYKPVDLARLGAIGGMTVLAAGVVVELVTGGGPIAANNAGYRFAGTQHPNHAGLMAALCVVSCLCLASRSSPRWLIVAAAALVPLLLTKSRTALAATVLAATIYCVLAWPARRVAAGALLATLGLALVGALNVAGALGPVWNALLLGRGDSDVRTMTGRTGIWQAALEYLGHDPARYLTGFGFDSFWSGDATRFVSNRVRWNISEGHNAYLDMTLELGVVGAACFAAMLLAALGTCARRARRAHTPAHAALCAAIVGFALIHALAESSSIDPNVFNFFVLCAVGFAAVRVRRAGVLH